ncbi:MAG: TerC/Alx family metal homeostasis membrane protein [Bacteroidetes bacterium]|nr:TerC/Alx family metal homeostasis membrane protein [Bacteroidota bacterium]
MNLNETLFFGTFLFFISLILTVDLGVFNKKGRLITFKESLFWTSLWVSIAIGFYGVILTKGNLIHGIENLDQLRSIVASYKHPIEITGLNYETALSVYRSNLGLEYITGYLIEYALSIDNVFVMIVIFMAFGVDKLNYHRILFWGIFGAIVMRFLFIFSASALIQEFSWTLYVFGALLVFTGIKMFLTRNQEEKMDTENHPVVKYVSNYFSVASDYKGHKFFTRINNKRYITPLFIVLLVIEFTDVLFAVDSVPAIFSITNDPYIVFFSNVFAIIGLRSLFFLLMHAMACFHYLKIGLSVLLTFIGLKLLAHFWLEQIGFKTVHSLYVVVGILLLSMISSLIFPKKEKKIN